MQPAGLTAIIACGQNRIWLTVNISIPFVWLVYGSIHAVNDAVLLKSMLPFDQS